MSNQKYFALFVVVRDLNLRRNGHHKPFRRLCPCPPGLHSLTEHLPLLLSQMEKGARGIFCAKCTVNHLNQWQPKPLRKLKIVPIVCRCYFDRPRAKLRVNRLVKKPAEFPPSVSCCNMDVIPRKRAYHPSSDSPPPPHPRVAFPAGVGPLISTLSTSMSDSREQLQLAIYLLYQMEKGARGIFYVICTANPGATRAAAAKKKEASGAKKAATKKPTTKKLSVPRSGPFETALRKILTPVKSVGRVLCVCTAIAYDIINCPLSTEAVMEKVKDNNMLVLLTLLRANKNHGKKYSVKLSLGL
ncbi:ribosomal protein L23a [Culex quinquefasciatus]|uniref:Ribosomal protein L23a n=1 Tax=Culex quinquefasciatus TaxID=7176 RepID=B0X0J4_CULQU|nr:ribosomal protein L23a [Culex quinquefasciatus]|eukprot:XP_001863166.1 ribosomal protein L23a [Culex quinquefasciatus]